MSIYTTAKVQGQWEAHTECTLGSLCGGLTTSLREEQMEF